MINKHALYASLLSLVFSACTTADLNYADRNNLDTARGRCEELARTAGYRDVLTESIDKDDQAEWKVGFIARKDGKDQ